MNIFEALRESHDIQRELVDQVIATSGDTPERHERFAALKLELSAHALAEERHFYVPLMDSDAGVDLSRHAIAEHHEIDEMVEELDATEASSPAWLPLAKKLGEKVQHHLKEEEHTFFQMAGKILDDGQKEKLSRAYFADYRKAKEKG